MPKHKSSLTSNRSSVIKSNSFKNEQEEKNNNKTDNLFNTMSTSEHELLRPTVKSWVTEDNAFKIKCLIFIITFIFGCANSFFEIAVFDLEFDEIVDSIHILTAEYNQYLFKNINLRDSLMITSSLIQDITMISLCVFWIKLGTNWRPMIAIALYYAFKILLQETFFMKYPEGYMWEYPGFPSLFVTYDKSSNFFFSGIVGLNFIAGLFLYDLKTIGTRFIACISFVNLFFQSVFFICLRSNYSIDIFTSVFSAHFFYLISKYLNVYAEKIYSLADTRFERDLKLGRVNSNDEKIDAKKEYYFQKNLTKEINKRKLT